MESITPTVEAIIPILRLETSTGNMILHFPNCFQTQIILLYITSFKTLNDTNARNLFIQCWNRKMEGGTKGFQLRIWLFQLSNVFRALLAQLMVTSQPVLDLFLKVSKLKPTVMINIHLPLNYHNLNGCNDLTNQRDM